MDEHQKYAYRYLLYWATLDIRPIAWLPHRGHWFSPFFWVRHIRRVRALGELAEWLHNMAAFSGRDFAGFDEQRFWQEFERFRAAHPDFKYYRSLFENALTESRTGRWPSVEEQRRRDAYQGRCTERRDCVWVSWLWLLVRRRWSFGMSERRWAV